MIRIVASTLRLKVEDPRGFMESEDFNAPHIWCLWHNRVAVGAGLWRRFARGRTGYVLASASRDGAVLAAAIGVAGMKAVRGSSSRRGATALKELLRVLKDGNDAAVTPDGPRGPRYVLQPGVVKLAQASGVPIMPLHIDISRSWRLNTWDRFHIPRPFSKVTLTLDERITIPRHLDDAEFEAARGKLEAIMHRSVREKNESNDGGH